MLSSMIIAGANRQLTMVISHEMIMKTINVTTALVSNLLTASHSNNDVKKVLQELDIEATTKTGEALVRELSKKVLERESIKVCLRYLHKSIKHLNFHLENLDTELREYEERYLKWFRYPTVDTHIVEIQQEYGIMQQRLNMLIKLLQTHP